MAESRNFRNALNGFNREDVVRYIEEMNNRHNTLVNQLRAEKQSLADALADLQSKNNVPSITAEEYESLQQELAALRAEVEILRAAPAPAPAPASPAVSITEEELAAYRRAEQAERTARERAQQIYRQATAALADANARISDSVALLDTITGRVTTQIGELQTAVTESRATLQDTAAAIAAIGSEE